ncbi:hypothetical protein Pcinc_006123 [Petrolisthes cinctipes]|uniref:Uncharacterized protein n=1 Tax=Petrolisthes cinctipes TaxID=88211 RepID=A0AAE1GDG6_PETCI|nr:hypothetical protein Pcinc_006123 [Petrolisthes cinctipes]
MNRRLTNRDEVILHVFGFHRNIRANPMKDCYLKIMTLLSSTSLFGLFRLERYRTVATLTIPWVDHSVGKWVSSTPGIALVTTTFTFVNSQKVTVQGPSTPKGKVNTFLVFNRHKIRQNAQLLKAGHTQVRFVCTEDGGFNMKSGELVVDVTKQQTEEKQQHRGGLIYKIEHNPVN